MKKPLTGRLSIEFWYKDQTVENLNGEKIIDGYSLIREIKGKFIQRSESSGQSIFVSKPVVSLDDNFWS